jgi:hypothetical protein
MNESMNEITIFTNLLKKQYLKVKKIAGAPIELQLLSKK